LPAILYSQTQSQPQRQIKQYTIEQFLATTTISDSSFSHDDKNILFTSDQSGIPNVYRLSVEGGKPVALTHSEKDSTYAVSYFPEDDRFLFSQDQGGNENTHLYSMDEKGEQKDLTPGDKIKANFIKWARDKKGFYFSTNE